MIRLFAILLLALILVLAGCTTMPAKEAPIFVKYKYVITVIPDELLELPEPVYKLDPNTATDKEAGVWIVDSERRAIELEKRLKRIKAYQDKQLGELKKLPPEDVVKR